MTNALSALTYGDLEIMFFKSLKNMHYTDRFQLFIQLNKKYIFSNRHISRKCPCHEKYIDKYRNLYFNLERKKLIYLSHFALKMLPSPISLLLNSKLMNI